MFLAIIITITFVWVAAEWLLFSRTVAHWRRSARALYATLTALCSVPFWICFFIGRTWDIQTTFWAVLGAVNMILFLLNAGVKITLAAGLLASLKSRRRWPMAVASVVAVIFAGLIGYGTFIESQTLCIKHLTIYSDNLPAEAEGLRIAQISDVHFSLRPSSASMARKITSALEQIGPDIILDCGDLVNTRHSELTEEILATLATIKAPLGIYTVEGNHDRGDYITDTLALPLEENHRLYLEKLASIGWQDLTGRTVAIAVGDNIGDTLYLTGLPYPASLGKGTHGEAVEEDYTANFATIPDGAFNIVLAHNPMAWPSILNATEAELTLSGHVHSMQMKLPIGERGWSPAAWIYPHWSGHYEQEGCHLNISDGIGSALPIRVGVPPSIVVIELRKGNSNHSPLS